jgi:hypothetical protein
LGELTRYIEKSMPEDAPEKCTGEDAQAVAAYIYESFYSPTAQARNRPARIDLARLTVRQYQQSLADLLGSFLGQAQWGPERGLRGEYFKARRFNRGQRVLERVDPQVRFNFGTDSPLPGQLEPHEFSIRWEGALLAPDTGSYELILRTDHAARLWLNERPDPLVDAWVRSGSDTVHRASIKLLAGRAYPLRLEFSKAKQGVDDSKKNKDQPPPAPALVELAWIRPDRSEEPVPQRWLLPQSVPQGYAVETPFPPDDRSLGYERGTEVSPQWERATTDAALEVVAWVIPRLNVLAGTGDGAGDRAEKLRDFCRRFVERAFRRPLTDEQLQLYVERQFAAAPEPELAVKQVLLLALKSPRFLYREAEAPAGDPYHVASRLAFGMWDSLPDDALLAAAAAGQLSLPEQLAAQAKRMLADPRAQAKLREFFWRWLKLDRPVDLAKDPAHYPEFTAEIAADLRNSLELFLEQAVQGEGVDYRQLLLAESLPLNGRLARFYGLDRPADASFENLPLDPEHRAGLLTHPYVLAAYAYTGTTSPIHRGVFISRNLLGRTLRPPPEAVAPLAPELHADLTTRERVALQTRSQVCMTCHGMINPLGFTLEQFDAVGRFRSEEQGKPVDPSGAYVTRDGQTVQFEHVRQLAQFLADSPESQAAFVQQMFHYLIKQPIRAHGPQTLPRLQEAFREQRFQVRQLMAAIVARAATGPAAEDDARSELSSPGAPP